MALRSPGERRKGGRRGFVRNYGHFGGFVPSRQNDFLKYGDDSGRRRVVNYNFVADGHWR